MCSVRVSGIVQEVVCGLRFNSYQLQMDINEGSLILQAEIDRLLVNSLSVGLLTGAVHVVLFFIFTNCTLNGT